ncbi:hypothetical protein BASA50_005386 [Batrachochytrium salamandrivorans]|uniref:Protein phosphatase inhibitor 2 n=1 Tax=Batrachochytrium salamandrivorans TaxID=1357716 RepID=A0ABQ8FCS7_9FUNG|nr:hypothetical protein BASA50_005386 [Batrachochytrium salamandrivorans]
MKMTSSSDSSHGGNDSNCSNTALHNNVKLHLNGGPHSHSVSTNSELGSSSDNTPLKSTTTRGILKRRSQSEQPKLRGICWDEENLTLTEAQKDSTMKITEPKTPFIQYDLSTDQLLGSTGEVPPLELVAAIEKSRNRSDSLTLEELPDELKQHMQVSDKDGMEWQSDGEADGVTDDDRNKRLKFSSLRSEHYNMQNVLRRGRELIQHEVEDDGYNDPDLYNDDDPNDLSESLSDADPQDHVWEREECGQSHRGIILKKGETPPFSSVSEDVSSNH